MTPAAPPVGPAIWVVGVDASGARVVRERLAHGDDPTAVLNRAGYAVAGPRTVTAQANPHEVTVVFGVTSGPVEPVASEAASRDEGLVVAAGEDAVVVQRLAVYALVHSDRGILLAENSDRTNAAGTWALPGGGLDASELPEAALHREVWEETGQYVRITDLAAVTTRHWVGRAPNGRLEDFHAVRIVYRATCDEPSDPVVHDVGGTTAASGWFTPDQVGGLPLGVVAKDLLRDFIGDVG